MAGGAGASSEGAAASAPNTTTRVPCGVQTSAQATSPREAASACDTVGTSASAIIASKASQAPQRISGRDRDEGRKNTGASVSEPC